MTPAEICKLLRTVIKEDGFTIHRFSEKSGIPERTLLELARHNNPCLKTICKILEALNFELVIKER